MKVWSTDLTLALGLRKPKQIFLVLHCANEFGVWPNTIKDHISNMIKLFFVINSYSSRKKSCNVARVGKSELKSSILRKSF